MLPKHCVSSQVHPEVFDCASVLFCDIVGFTPLCAQSSPEQVVTLLNELYNRYDSVMDTYDCYKVVFASHPSPY